MELDFVSVSGGLRPSFFCAGCHFGFLYFLRYGQTPTMISRILAPAACALAIVAGSNSIALGAGSLSDQYTQMGSIDGLAELCYGSKKFPEFISPRIKQLARTGQLDGDVATALIAKYIEAYKHAIVETTISIGTQQSYGKKPCNYSSGPDVAVIKQMEGLILGRVDGIPAMRI